MWSTSYLRLAILFLQVAVAALLVTLLTFSDNRPALAAPPTNDSFADSIVISEPLPFTDSRNTSGATTEVDEPSPCSDILSTIWYRFTPSSDISLIANTVGSDFDTVLGVYTGSAVDSLTVVACNDDISYPENPQSEVAFTATAGVAYHFQVGGFSGETGNLAFNLASAEADFDGDGVPDGSDNCPFDSNPGQKNTDGDQWGDACDDDDDNDGWLDGEDNCPTVATAWFVPVGDDDCDGFTTTLENYVGTDPDVACGAGAWPPDFDDNQFVNMFDVNAMRPPIFNLLEGKGTNPFYSERLDLNADDFVDMFDVNAIRPPFFNLLVPCTP